MKYLVQIHLMSALLISLLLVSGCKSTTTRTGPIAVGPGVTQSQSPSPEAKRYTYNSDIYLDVAIPVFNPGFPIDDDTGHVDYQELDELDIWPQLRRAEAKRFAVETKQALAKTKAFGSVSVVPNANTSADLYVLGTVLHSDSEFIRLEVTVVDSSGEPIDTEDFEHQVSESFFRDAMNQDKDPYEPVFVEVADYVYELLTDMSEQQKQQLKNTTLVRYAHYYAPDAFDGYLSQQLESKRGTQFYKYELNAMPAENDPMLQRIEVLRNQDMLFVDRLQDQFAVFQQTTNGPYRKWQRETLPEAVRAREARSERNTKAVIGALGFIAALALGNNSTSTSTAVAKTAGALGSAWLLKDAYQANENLRVASAVIDEMGQGLDLTLSPQVMEFNEQEVELTGTAAEQYEQWKAHLRKMYQLESSAN
ncbi:hypothetical protein MHM95_18350 [Pseudoalteromonas sp. CnMc7-15]|uniref:hypothetical protein n=1 Tax=unclassified Pseudoalteromonas TaxID=194690 RepID=UPI001EF44C94|nr:hypothetical protein [Pseudoalteromonas sp. CnMc7-15]MCG7568237.1 hypothetical protein [Pseudoalteromonas sp. CnMc7-15]